MNCGDADGNVCATSPQLRSDCASDAKASDRCRIIPSDDDMSKTVGPIRNDCVLGIPTQAQFASNSAVGDRIAGELSSHHTTPSPHPPSMSAGQALARHTAHLADQQYANAIDESPPSRKRLLCESLTDDEGSTEANFVESETRTKSTSSTDSGSDLSRVSSSETDSGSFSSSDCCSVINDTMMHLNSLSRNGLTLAEHGQSSSCGSANNQHQSSNGFYMARNMDKLNLMDVHSYKRRSHSGGECNRVAMDYQTEDGSQGRLEDPSGLMTQPNYLFEQGDSKERCLGLEINARYLLNNFQERDTGAGSSESKLSDKAAAAIGCCQHVPQSQDPCHQAVCTKCVKSEMPCCSAMDPESPPSSNAGIHVKDERQTSCTKQCVACKENSTSWPPLMSPAAQDSIAAEEVQKSVRPDGGTDPHDDGRCARHHKGRTQLIQTASLNQKAMHRSNGPALAGHQACVNSMGFSDSPPEHMMCNSAGKMATERNSDDTLRTANYPVLSIPNGANGRFLIPSQLSFSTDQTVLLGVRSTRSPVTASANQQSYKSVTAVSPTSKPSVLPSCQEIAQSGSSLFALNQLSAGREKRVTTTSSGESIQIQIGNSGANAPMNISGPLICNTEGQLIVPAGQINLLKAFSELHGYKLQSASNGLLISSAPATSASPVCGQHTPTVPSSACPALMKHSNAIQRPSNSFALTGHQSSTQDAARKRELRLQKNREAARECRRKKKEYIKCLENRVAVLESENKGLHDDLRHLRELYCCQTAAANNTVSHGKHHHVHRMSPAVSSSPVPLSRPSSVVLAQTPTNIAGYQSGPQSPLPTGGANSVFSSHHRSQQQQQRQLVQIHHPAASSNGGVTPDPRQAAASSLGPACSRKTTPNIASDKLHRHQEI